MGFFRESDQYWRISGILCLEVRISEVEYILLWSSRVNIRELDKFEGLSLSIFRFLFHFEYIDRWHCHFDERGSSSEDFDLEECTAEFFLRAGVSAGFGLQICTEARLRFEAVLYVSSDFGVRLRLCF